MSGLRYHQFTVEKSIMSAVNVGNLLLLGGVFMIIKGFTLEKGLMSAVNVGSILLVAWAFFVVTEFTLKKGLITAVNVASLLLDKPVSMIITDFILEKGLLSAVNVGKPLSKDSSSAHIGKSTLEKSLMSARNVVNLSPEVATWLNISKVTLKKGLYKYCKYGWQWCQRSLRWWQSGQNLWSKWTLSRAETEAQRCRVICFMIPVERIRIWDWMPHCLVQAFGESGDFTPPLLYAHHVWGLKEHLVRPDTSAPSACTHEPCLHPNPCWWSGLSFLWEPTLMTLLWMTPFIYPAKPMLWFHPYHCHFRKKGCPTQRVRGTPPEELTTARPFWEWLHCTCPLAFLLPLRAGTPVPVSWPWAVHTDSSITTRGSSLISLCAHLPLTPSHLGSSTAPS